MSFCKCYILSSMNYYLQDFNSIDFKKDPTLYRVGKGEQGVLSVEPYKSEILPFWKFKNPEVAQISADQIYGLFLEYLENSDFVGADMARKFLQMGYTRSRRYANHKSGRKYSIETDSDAEIPTELPSFKDPKNVRHFIKTKTKKVLPLDRDPIKAKSAEIFYAKYIEAKNNAIYKIMKEEWRQKFG